MIKGLPVEQPLKILCNSSIRRKLNANPEGVVVLARGKVDSSWQLITYADVPEQSFVRSLISKGGDWGDRFFIQGRLDFFSEFLVSEHKLNQIQAFLEADRTPYATIKNLAQVVPKHKLSALLETYQSLDWHNLYVHMLVR